MTFTLPGVVAWGRTCQEYFDMFNLEEIPHDSSLLGAGDGPASFNAAMNRMNHTVISCDPLYSLTEYEITSRISIARKEVMEQVCVNRGNFVWDYFDSPDSLEQRRLAGMKEFLRDYPQGRKEGRYIPAQIPYLPFQNLSFDIALCSHLLFLYSSLGYTFHLDAIRELLRVASEVRVYPVVDLNCSIPHFRADLISELEKTGYICLFEQVTYNFIRNGDHMLRITRQ